MHPPSAAATETASALHPLVVPVRVVYHPFNACIGERFKCETQQPNNCIPAALKLGPPLTPPARTAGMISLGTQDVLLAQDQGSAIVRRARRRGWRPGAGTLSQRLERQKKARGKVPTDAAHANGAMNTACNCGPFWQHGPRSVGYGNGPCGGPRCPIFV